jgi:hypothetical protein
VFIPVHISLKWTYYVTLSGAVVKTVHCEGCHAAYLYRLERTCTGSGKSAVLFFDAAGATGRATKDAQQQLGRSLQKGIDLVPCPACGWYQQHMIDKARWDHFAWMLGLGVALIAGVFPLGMLGLVINSISGPAGPPPIPWLVLMITLVMLALIGAFLLGARSILASRYDPNDHDPEARIQLGRSRALLREEVEGEALKQEVSDHAAEEEFARIRELIQGGGAAAERYDCWMDCPCGAEIGLSLRQAGKATSCSACARKLLIPLALSKGKHYLPCGVDPIL